MPWEYARALSLSRPPVSPNQIQQVVDTGWVQFVKSDVSDAIWSRVVLVVSPCWGSALFLRN